MLLTDIILFTAPQLINKSIAIAEAQVSSDHAVVDDIETAIQHTMSSAPHSVPPLEERQV